MRTLSFVFESLNYAHAGNIDAIRRDTVEFVMNHFPETIRVDINGYEPAADVKIVHDEQEE